ncbi:MAG TPA: ATP-binding protein [Candidatus Elarobacter sp.]|nr:ATP-binding protein [Candidatus Elarobacter sp.]
MGYDLHDGALQEITALGHDLHFFREQLASDEAFERRRLLIGRVDDLVARLQSIDANLRNVATQSASHLLFDRPLALMLVEVAELAAGDVVVEFDIDHAFDELGLTDSQRIVIVRVVQGALTNVARHSGATHASVTLRQDDDEVVLEVRDDGQGFDLDAAATLRAETGRLGIIAMRERALLLGGKLTIDSSPAQSTTILLRLPRWRPQ